MLRSVICFVISVIAFNGPAIAQEVDWKKNVQGSWRINWPKTTALALEGVQRENASTLSMAPIASPSIQLTEKTIKFEICNASQSYRFESFDKKSGRITLLVENEGRQSNICFYAKNNDTLILDLPATVLGPLQVVYSRSGRKEALRPDSPLRSFVGEWKLEEALTRAMWKQSVSSEILKNYQSFAVGELCQTVRLSEFEILYSDQTFEPWEVKSHSGSKTVLASTYSPQIFIEINKISDNLIQIADSRKRQFAVYSKGEGKVDAETAIEPLPENRVASSFLDSFQRRPKRSRPNRAPKIGEDGDVEILAVDVDRRQSVDAVAGADIINMSIDLFFRSNASHLSTGGGYLVQLTRLDEIRDNQGTLLSTPRRRKSVSYLKGLARTNNQRYRDDGRSGTYVSIRLDAPKLSATRIQKVAGEAKLFTYEPRLIRFENVGALLNQQLEHPLLKGMDISPRIDNGLNFNFVLQLNERDAERILSWKLVTREGDELKPMSMGGAPGGISKGFLKPIPRDATLIIQTAMMRSAQTLPFEIKNIDLR